MRILLIALSLLYVIGVSYARTYFVGPEACPTPTDTAVYQGVVEAADLNQWRHVGEGVFPVIDVEVAENPQTDQIFARMAADPETGAVFSIQSAPCKPKE